MRRNIHDDGPPLSDWFSRAGIREIRVVSPHLDDAAFSVAEFLSRPEFPPRHVFSVFTEAGPSTLAHHAHNMGFSDPAEEFRCRRAEDITAMRRLGVNFTHCGADSGRMDAENARKMHHLIAEGLAAETTMVLLPLGAGQSLSGLSRLCRRILRIPPGCDVHGEHLWVRDELRKALAADRTRVGFYAEVPYHWANNSSELVDRARTQLARSVDVFALRPDLDRKLKVVRDYNSQYEAEFGNRKSFQRRTASISERIFLPSDVRRPT